MSFSARNLSRSALSVGRAASFRSSSCASSGHQHGRTDERQAALTKVSLGFVKCMQFAFNICHRIVDLALNQYQRSARRHRTCPGLGRRTNLLRNDLLSQRVDCSYLFVQLLQRLFRVDFTTLESGDLFSQSRDGLLIDRIVQVERWSRRERRELKSFAAVTRSLTSKGLGLSVPSGESSLSHCCAVDPRPLSKGLKMSSACSCMVALRCSPFC